MGFRILRLFADAFVVQSYINLSAKHVMNISSCPNFLFCISLANDFANKEGDTNGELAPRLFIFEKGDTNSP